jgi:protein-tyrosine phosphatase
VKLFLAYHPVESGKPLTNLPDPYYGGPEGFEQVLDLVERASSGFLKTIVPGTNN